ncbi:hypothetical protein S7711_02209 [Stachybotrys chartarum IBT 7711]|uniref:Uncharacterized protein n=1 Tax=Stachybotrys chartarum (strain CBS 109288 / IBT 7711) TaxID=1280523 RepID=A0A084AZ76_STACB|nr:hypothetical protein S7711_02209 [Stachybotrys chartarum IBT 7711]
MLGTPVQDGSRPSVSSRSGGRHQIKRSITELASPMRLHLQPHHRKDRQHDDKAAQSAHPSFPLRSSFDVSRSEGVTPLGLDQSLRASLMVRKEEEDTLQQMLQDSHDERGLQKEREDAGFRVEVLKQSLEDLHTFSTITTKRLDETYYAVLEKMSALQNTVAALKDLAETSRDIHGSFEKGSRSLENDIVTQLSSLGRFEEQRTKINSLQSRIHSGRSKMQSLSRRVDAVRERIEGWARADKEWQDRTRKRLRYFWVILSVLLLALVVLLASANHAEKQVLDLVPDIRRHRAGEATGPEGSPGSFGAANRPQLRQEDEPGAAGSLQWEASAGDDGRLRVFDEL